MRVDFPKNGILSQLSSLCGETELTSQPGEAGTSSFPSDKPNQEPKPDLILATPFPLPNSSVMGRLSAVLKNQKSMLSRNFFNSEMKIRELPAQLSVNKGH